MFITIKSPLYGNEAYCIIYYVLGKCKVLGQLLPGFAFALFYKLYIYTVLPFPNHFESAIKIIKLLGNTTSFDDEHKKENYPKKCN